MRLVDDPEIGRKDSSQFGLRLAPFVLGTGGFAIAGRHFLVQLAGLFGGCTSGRFLFLKGAAMQIVLLRLHGPHCTLQTAQLHMPTPGKA